MPREMTLAEYLGVVDPVLPKEQQIVTTPAPSITKLTVKSFCQDIIQSREYRESILRRVIMDQLPQAIETMLWNRAYGPVVEKVEVKDTSDQLEDMTAEQLEERARKLADVALHLRLSEHSAQEDEKNEAVH